MRIQTICILLETRAETERATDVKRFLLYFVVFLYSTYTHRDIYPPKYWAAFLCVSALLSTTYYSPGVPPISTVLSRFWMRRRCTNTPTTVHVRSMVPTSAPAITPPLSRLLELPLAPSELLPVVWGIFFSALPTSIVLSLSLWESATSGPGTISGLISSREEIMAGERRVLELGVVACANATLQSTEPSKESAAPRITTLPAVACWKAERTASAAVASGVAMRKGTSSLGTLGSEHGVVVLSKVRLRR